MLTKPMVCVSALFGINRFQSKVCMGCHDLLQKAKRVLMMLRLFKLKEMNIEFHF